MEIVRKPRKLTKDGLAIKERLAELGMTQRELCKVIGIREQVFCDILHTERRYKQRQRREVLEYLGITDKAVGE